MPTPTELKTEIETGPLASELSPHVTAGNHRAIADALNRRDSGTVVYGRTLNHRGLLANMDPAQAAVIMDKFEAAASGNSTVKWALYSLKGEIGLDIDHPNTRAQIDALVSASVFMAQEGADLKALAERTGSRAEVLWGAGTHITHQQVREALAL